MTRVGLTEVDIAILVLWLHDARSPEIAERTGLSPAAVRKRLERTVDRIRGVALSGDSRERCHTSPRRSELGVKLGEMSDEGTKNGTQEGRTP